MSYKRRRSSAMSKVFEELKYHDVVVGTATQTDGTARAEALNFIDRGSAATERIGQKIIIRSLEAAVQIVPLSVPVGAAPVTYPKVIHICIFFDKMHNSTGTIATFEDVYNLDADSWKPFRNLDNTSRYDVIMVKTLVISARVIWDNTAATFEASFPSLMIEVFKKFKTPKIVEYAANSVNPTTLGEVDRNLLIFSTFSQNTAMDSSAQFICNCSCRLRYND